MPRTLSIIGTLIAVAVIAYLAIDLRSEQPERPAPKNSYVSETYGIAFEYPDSYVLEQGSRGNPGNSERSQYSIVLTRQEDFGPRVDSEGPTTITIDIYDNIPEATSLTKWLFGKNESNFKLSDGAIASTTIDGVEARTYRWSGLYEAETTAFIHNDRIIAVTVTYIAPTDANISVFRDLLASIELTAAGSTEE